jgi:hypothetical protein
VAAQNWNWNWKHAAEKAVVVVVMVMMMVVLRELHGGRLLCACGIIGL